MYVLKAVVVIQLVAIAALPILIDRFPVILKKFSHVIVFLMQYIQLKVKLAIANQILFILAQQVNVFVFLNLDMRLHITMIKIYFFATFALLDALVHLQVVVIVYLPHIEQFQLIQHLYQHVIALRLLNKLIIYVHAYILLIHWLAHVVAVHHIIKMQVIIVLVYLSQLQILIF